MKAVGLVLLSVFIRSFGDVVQDKDDYPNRRVLFEKVGNPDDTAIIERPCPVYDLDCIRIFFAKHGKCIIKDGPIPNALPRSQYSTYASRSNITVTHVGTMIYGLSSTRIEDFYINKDTNQIVFAIQASFSFFTPSAYFRFYRNGKEPITTLAFTFVDYNRVTFTAVIPNIDDIQLDKAEVTTDSDVPNPTLLLVGPGVVRNNPDPTVIASLADFAANQGEVFKEIMLTQAPFFPATYIQYNICDFGLKIY